MNTKLIYNHPVVLSNWLIFNIFAKNTHDLLTNPCNGEYKHKQVQYIEFLSEDLDHVRKFYSSCFGWKFTEYGPDYYMVFGGDHVDRNLILGKAG